jgi:hypothetical protein
MFSRPCDSIKPVKHARLGLAYFVIFACIHAGAVTMPERAAPDWSLETAARETVRFYEHAVADEYDVKGTPGLFVTDRAHAISYVRNSGTPPEAVETMVRAILERELRAVPPD